MTTDPAADRESKCAYVTAPLTQVVTGLPVTRDACSVCGRRLRDGTAVTVQLALTGDTWAINACRCRDCPRPSGTTARLSRVLAGTLAVCSRAHTQTHELCLVDVEPLADHTPTASQ